MGILDALSSRHTFIVTYEGLGECLDDEVIIEITQRVEYFMDESDTAYIRNMYDKFCPSELDKAQTTDAQTVCSILLYAYVMIADKRYEMITLMLSLLANTERFSELTLGYINVQEEQKKSFIDWLETSFAGTDDYCSLFEYHLQLWDENEVRKAETLRLIDHYAPIVSLQKNCISSGKINRKLCNLHWTTKHNVFVG